MSQTINRDKWLEQLARVRRWYTRVNDVRPKEGRVRVSEDDRDTLYAFFINCYHLWDWMKKSCVVDKKALNGFFKEKGSLTICDGDFNRLSMQMCYDICIAAKHLKGDRDPRPGHENLVAREYDPGSHTGNHITRLALFTIDGKPKQVDLFSLADLCMGSLENFFSKNGLVDDRNHSPDAT